MRGTYSFQKASYLEYSYKFKEDSYTFIETYTGDEPEIDELEVGTYKISDDNETITFVEDDGNSYSAKLSSDKKEFEKNCGAVASYTQKIKLASVEDTD